MVLAPEHPLVAKITTPDKKAEVEAYVARTRRFTDIERLSTEKEKDGVFTGAYVINRLTGDKVPVWIADYVLASYGTGAVMAVPAHDERDFAFAKKYNIPIKVVIAGPDWKGEELTAAYVEDGMMINSKQFDGMNNRDGIKAVTAIPGNETLGQRHHQLPHARLADFPPALLGRAHPDDSLSRNAALCRYRKKTCRFYCRKKRNSNRPANRR